ncbi:hypothetical protein [Deinococcus multiflagellatus]|uniref:Zinc ribbon domain-containing protein n=1 Tax=Deinococcus multiflagellatus TaxID=1656887 RepID=A0ABW1ZHV8_9DEIO|nr:hypothetical protein [Deinococcus multiflagellatus]MBZ9713792.1 hypothetical protein [Deinococcus multiflagellatus]
MNAHDVANRQQIEVLLADLQENAQTQREAAERLAELPDGHPDRDRYARVLAQQRQQRIEQLEGTGAYRPTVWCLNPGCHAPYPAELPACPECGAATRPPRRLAATPCACGQPRLDNVTRCEDCEALL